MAGPSLWASLGLNINPFRVGISDAKNAAKHGGREIASALGEFASEKLAQIASVAAAEQAIEKTIEYAEVVRKLAIRTGESTDTIQRWSYAAMKSETDLNALIAAFEKFQILQAKARAGDKDASGTLSPLGLSTEQINNLSGAASNFELIGDKIKGAEINGQLLKDITEAFGKQAREIIPVFKNDLREAGDEAQRLGTVMSAKSIAEAAEASERLKMAWFSLRPVVADVVGWASRRLMDMADFFKLTVGVIAVDFQARRDATKRAPTLLGRMAENGFGQKDKAANTEDTVKKARNDYIEKVMREREEREKVLAKMESNLRGEGAKIPYAPEESGESKAEAKSLKERERLAEKLADMQAKHYLDSLTKEKQLTELHRRRAELAAFIAEKQKEMTPENLLKAQIDLEEIAGEEGRVQREVDSGMKSKAKIDLTANERIGAYSAAPEFSIADATRKSEQHLSAIRKDLAKLSRHGVGSGVAF